MTPSDGSPSPSNAAKWSRWLPILLVGVPVALAWATFRWVSLIPQVDQRFFFTPGSPIYRAH
jgi:hypothetical protein